MSSIPEYIKKLECNALSEALNYLDNLKKLNWNDIPQEIYVNINSLVINKKYYNSFWNLKSQEDLTTFLSTFKNCILQNDLSFYNISYRRHDLKRILLNNYDYEVDSVLENNPILLLKEKNNFTIIDGMHRFLGKYSKELKQNPNINGIYINSYLATTKEFVLNE